MSPGYDLVILSDCVLDAYYRIDRLPVRPEEAQESLEPHFYPGGACNVAIAARKLGLKVAVVDKLGNDCFSRILTEALRKEGVDLKVSLDDMHTTAVSNNLIDKKGRHAFVGHGGAGLYINESELDEELIVSSRAVFFDGYSLKEGYPVYGFIRKAVNLAKASSKLVFFDPGPRRVKNIAEFIRHSDAVFFNKKELLMHMGMSFREAVNELKKDSEKVYVVKNGDRGSMCISKGKTIRIKPFKPRRVLHTIGAGDVYDATFISFFLRGYPIELACTYASLMASLKLEREHAGQLPELNEFLRIAEGYGLKGLS